MATKIKMQKEKKALHVEAVRAMWQQMSSGTKAGNKGDKVSK